MGRRGGAKRAPNTTFGSNNAISLREELTGKKQIKGGSIPAKSALKLEHLQRLGVWAAGEASIPSLGAFFGHTLASAQDALGAPPDPSVFTCQRCETILQPGFNCTVRIEKNRAKARRRSKKPSNFTQNNVVYTCHFCSHQNLKRGTPNGHMKVICPPKTKTTSKLKPTKSISKKFVSSKKSIEDEDDVRKANEIASSQMAREICNVNEIASSEKAIEAGVDEVGKAFEIGSSEIAIEPPVDEVGEANEIASSEMAIESPTVDSPATPMVRTGTTLLGGNRRKRNNSASKKRTEPENSSIPADAENAVSTSKKRRRKSWTSLKEIAESSDRNKFRNISDLVIPLFVNGA